MAATDTYMKYNLHSAAPYIGQGEMSGYAKSRRKSLGGKRPGGVFGGGMSYTPQRTELAASQLSRFYQKRLMASKFGEYKP